MRTFRCPVCAATTFFDDHRCVACGTALGYRPDIDAMAPLDTRVNCLGVAAWACNWLVDDGLGWCRSCRLDVDDPHAPTGSERRAFEAAKRRVVRQLLAARLDLFAVPQLRFRFERSGPDHSVTIGHADGLVTLDLAEADPVTSERVRAELGEPYRTPLGHVRHETGHWHWQAWVATRPARLEASRDLFGDERADYAAALEQHYDRTDDGAWRDRFVSFYASAHPWEDYAESFAHVLHLRDTLETAAGFGLAMFDAGADFDTTYHQWTSVSVAVNELSRSLGVADLYPFAPPETAIAKLRFVNDVLLDRI